MDAENNDMMMDPPADMMMDPPADMGMDPPADMGMEAPAAMDNMAAMEPAAMMDPPAAMMDPPAEEGDGLLGGIGAGALGAITNPAAMFSPGDEDSDNTVQRKPVRTPFCCCLCNCSNELTEGQTCLCLFPIKCGVVTIGILTFFVTAYIFLEVFMNLRNIYLPWWFSFVTAILLVPSIISTSFFIGFFTKDCKRTRGTLTSAAIMTLVSVLLIAIWECVYYGAIDRNDAMYTGIGEDPAKYHKGSKRSFVYWSIAFDALFLAFWAYFIVVVKQYVALYPVEEKEAAKETDMEAANAKTD
jgi:hypothetical protein